MPYELQTVFVPRNRDILWTTGYQKQIALKDMEEIHIQNTMIYLHKKETEWEETRKRMQGYNIGQLICNERPVNEWLHCFAKELERRRKI